MINLINYKDYAFFDYRSEGGGKYFLGDVVQNIDTNEIGVIIQTFISGEFRTDQFGMACESDVREATQSDIDTHRPTLIEDAKRKAEWLKHLTETDY